MTDLQELKIKINFLRNFLKKNSIDEPLKNSIEFFLTNEFSYITNLTVKMKIEKFKRVTVNSKICDGKRESLSKIDQLKYPPNGARNYGRANLIGDKILYATDDIPTALKEARVKKDDLITISTWKLRTDYLLCVTPIFKNFPNKSDVLNIDFFNFFQVYNEAINKNFNRDERIVVNEFVQFLTDCFTKEVEENNQFDYFLSSFYANRLFNFLNNGMIEAILYPSMRTNLITTNIAIKHNIFDNNYDLEGVEEKIVLQVPHGENDYCELKPIKKTSNFKNHEIIW